MKNWLKSLIPLPKNLWISEKIKSVRTDGTFENFVANSLLGFSGGVFLTYMFFIFFVFQLNFTLPSATFLCSIFGIILTIGLAFSDRVRYDPPKTYHFLINHTSLLHSRCIVFLLLPQFFSKRGRHALMAYAFILTITGPAKNTLHNVGVLSESLACTQVTTS